MERAIRMSLALTVLAVWGGGNAMSATAAGTAAPAPPLPPVSTCKVAQLKVRATWAARNTRLPGGGALVGGVIVRNRGATACAISGFPVVRIISSSGAVLPVRERHAALSAAGSATVVLLTGERAHAPLQWLNWCRGALAAPLRLRVRLPRATARRLVTVDKGKSAGGVATASCVNPKAGSVLDVGRFVPG